MTQLTVNTSKGVSKCSACARSILAQGWHDLRPAPARRAHPAAAPNHGLVALLERVGVVDQERVLRLVHLRPRRAAWAPHLSAAPTLTLSAIHALAPVDQQCVLCFEHLPPDRAAWAAQAPTTNYMHHIY